MMHSDLSTIIFSAIRTDLRRMMPPVLLYAFGGVKLSHAPQDFQNDVLLRSKYSKSHNETSERPSPCSLPVAIRLRLFLRDLGNLSFFLLNTMREQFRDSRNRTGSRFDGGLR